jgi:hypothetical protein
VLDSPTDVSGAVAVVDVSTSPVLLDDELLLSSSIPVSVTTASGEHIAGGGVATQPWFWLAGTQRLQYGRDG